MPKYYEPVFPEDVDPDSVSFGHSSHSPGDITEHLFEDGKLIGHAAWREVEIPDDDYDDTDDDQPSPQASQEAEGLLLAAALLAVVGIGLGVAKAAPHVVRWWKGTFVPFIRSTFFDEVKIKETEVQRAIPRLVVTPEGEPVEASKDLAMTHQDEPVTMSPEEWQRHFATMILAGAIADQEWRLLAKAHIEGEDMQALQAAMGQLTPQQFADAVNRVLEEHPDLLRADSPEELLELLQAKPADSEKPKPKRIELSKPEQPDEADEGA